MKPQLLQDTEGWSVFSFSNGQEIKIDLLQRNSPYTKKLNGKQELLAKACGLTKSGVRILDVTFGLGQDSWTLLRLGAQVIGIEREPLLVEGFQGSLRTAGLEVKDLTNRFKLHCGQAIDFLKAPKSFDLDEVDTIFLDPMYSEDPKKTALPRKEMQLFREWLGSSSDAETQRLLEQARRYPLQNAQFRVVVKRPLKASVLAPGFFHQFKGKTVRFDCYKGLSQ